MPLPRLVLINPDHVSDEEVQTYETRPSVRAVVLDDAGRIALIHVGKYGFYELPGGGIEGTETKEEALKRECLEEIGCKVEMISEIGWAEERRKPRAFQQLSYIFLARVVGEKGTPMLTDAEKEHQATVAWFPPAEAVEKLKTGQTEHPTGRHYIIPRDSMTLEKAVKMLKALA